MQRNLNLLDRRSRFKRWGMLVLTAVALTACGPLGDDAEDPTPTSETITVPTANPDQETDSTPDIPPFLPDDNGATPEPPLSTPVVTVPNNPPGMQASPDTPVLDNAATPVTTVPDNGPAATPVPAGEDTSFAGSDGTSGATPASNVPPEDDSEPTDATDTGTPVAEPGATPESVALADLQPVTVTSCAPDTVPPLGSAPTEYLTVTDVNFRAGPGADCDAIGAGPIGINIPVTVLSGPVVREGDEDFTWVQVEIADDIGWIIIGVLEPVS